MISISEQVIIAPASCPPHLVPGKAVLSPAWREILLVEPDVTLLTAQVLLLTRLDYCVTPAFSQGEIFALRETKAIALAILSDCLGPQILAAIAHRVRKQWPRARILIVGQPQFMLEDHLYDEEVSRSLDPRGLSEDLERLYKGSWNQRSHTLDWNINRSGPGGSRSLIRESDPTKFPTLNLTDEALRRDTPSGIGSRRR